MDYLGRQLRIVRERLGLSLREVERRSVNVAQERGSDQYKISWSWLGRVESEPNHVVGAHPLIALLTIYCISLEELLAVNSALDFPEDTSAIGDAPGETRLLLNSPAELAARNVLPDNCTTVKVPETIEVHHWESSKRNGRFLRVIVGRDKNYLHPIVPSGSLAIVDTYRRSLGQLVDAEVEIQRPMFLLEYRNGKHICCWCELVDRSESRIIVLPHPTTRWRAFELVLDKDVYVRGQVVVVRIPTVMRGA
jgi:hypothetical protein